MTSFQVFFGFTPKTNLRSQLQSAKMKLKTLEMFGKVESGRFPPNLMLLGNILAELLNFFTKILTPPPNLDNGKMVKSYQYSRLGFRKVMME
ncbi:Uncharacterized protein TCM_020701 [Theobroma cacao]|uniref:Uncharacterized protein n=1 Tax=Theobroma cacao TaxID=3641 RepID=A0A061ELS9_THECC|nr:Uncharacterized protein TCM_020701 [Theobroma cacao]